MISKKKISRYIAQLVIDTMKNRVDWSILERGKIDSLERDQKIMGKVYETVYKQQILRFYRYNEEIIISELEYYNDTAYRLEFIDSHNRNIWIFPQNIRELEDLYSNVQIKASNLDSYFNNMFPD